MADYIDKDKAYEIHRLFSLLCEDDRREILKRLSNNQNTSKGIMDITT